MEVLQLAVFKLLNVISLYFINTCSWVLNAAMPLYYASFNVTSKTLFFFPYNITIFFAIKFLLSIMFLILIRGGTPRYRYDYLTKLGWLKFIGLVVLIFILSLLMFFLF